MAAQVPSLPGDMPSEVQENVIRLCSLELVDQKQDEIIKRLQGEFKDCRTALEFCVDRGLIIARNDGTRVVYSSAPNSPALDADDAKPRHAPPGTSTHKGRKRKSIPKPLTKDSTEADPAAFGTTSCNTTAEGTECANKSAETTVDADSENPVGSHAPTTDSTQEPLRSEMNMATAGTTDSLMIDISALWIDAAIQPREQQDDDTIAKYALAIEQGAEFPPILVFRCDGNLLLVDGFHRVRAFERAGRKDIKAIVRDGSRIDAALASLQQNLMHGLPLKTTEKKKRLLEFMEMNPEYRRKVAYSQMGKDFGLDAKTCQSVYEDHFPLGERDAVYSTQQGVQKRVGKRKTVKEQKQAPRGETKPAATSDETVTTDAASPNVAVAPAEAGIEAPHEGTNQGGFDEVAPLYEFPVSLGLLQRLIEIERLASSISQEAVEEVSPNVDLTRQVRSAVVAMQELTTRLEALLQATAHTCAAA